MDANDVQREAQSYNAFRLDLWDDPRKEAWAPDNERRLLAVVFDLSVGRAAFTEACARFPGRAITLRHRARIICDSARDAG